MIFNLKMSIKTPVTILQEFMVRRHETLNYELICNGVGTHEPLFKYRVTGLGKTAFGSGKSKKEAKHEAARLLLYILKEEVNVPELISSEILNEMPSCYSPYDHTIKDNAVGALQIFCCDNQLQDPKYELVLDVGPPHFKQFTIRCTVSSFSFEATARTKKQAKHRCSNGVLKLLKLCLSDYLDSSDSYVNDQSLSCDLCIKTICLGYQLSDLCNIFTTEQYKDSFLLKNLKDNIISIDKPLDILTRLGEELNFELDIKEIPSIDKNTIVNIFLVSKPGWSFIGTGEDYNSAVKAAALEAINFLIIMSTS